MTDDPVSLIGVRGYKDTHSKNVAQQTDVIDALMGFSIFSHIESDVSAGDFDLCVIDVTETMLVVGLANPKHTEVCEDGSHTAGRKGSGAGCRVMLLDSGLEKVVRVILVKRIQFDGAFKVAIECGRWEDCFHRLPVPPHEVHDQMHCGSRFWSLHRR